MIKAVIFDLDDTLCDTTGTIVQPARKNAAKILAKATGKDVKTILKIMEEKVFKKYTPTFTQNRNRLVRAVGINNKEKVKILSKKITEAYHSAPVEKLKLFSGAKSLLIKLRKKHKIALVSTGKTLRQLKKLRVLKIENLFDTIVINDVNNEEITKKDCFEKVMDKFKVKPSEVIVVGDKITEEIKIANRIRMSTMRVKVGRFNKLKPRFDIEIPDYTVKNLKEAEKILMLL